MNYVKRIRGKLLWIGTSGLREACGLGLDNKHGQKLLAEPGHNVETICKRRSVDVENWVGVRAWDLRGKRAKVKVGAVTRTGLSDSHLPITSTLVCTALS